MIACDNCNSVRHEDNMMNCNDECSCCYCADDKECVSCVWSTGKLDEYGEIIMECVKCTKQKDKKKVTDEEIIKKLLDKLNLRRKNKITKEMIIDEIKKDD